MIRELFSATMLLFEPVGLILSAGFFLFSFHNKKKKVRRQKLAWGILLAVIMQAVGVVAVTMLLSGRG